MLQRGVTAIRLYVAGPNSRAIRCYEKAGFARTGEFWRDDPGLAPVDVARPESESLRPHVRTDGEVPQLRFYWMEMRRPDSG